MTKFKFTMEQREAIVREAVAKRDAIIAGETEPVLMEMIDAAMVEMQNIVPPLRRSDCKRLIQAALSVKPGRLAGDRPSGKKGAK